MKNTIGTQRKYPEKTRTIRSSMYCSAFCLNLNLTCTEFVFFCIFMSFVRRQFVRNLGKAHYNLTVKQRSAKRNIQKRSTYKNNKRNVQNRSTHKKHQNKYTK